MNCFPSWFKAFKGFAPSNRAEGICICYFFFSLNFSLFKKVPKVPSCFIPIFDSKKIPYQVCPGKKKVCKNDFDENSNFINFYCKYTLEQS